MLLLLVVVVGGGGFECRLIWWNVGLVESEERERERERKKVMMNEREVDGEFAIG